MGFDRRLFLRTLAAAAVGAALDPERLLWVPGQKTIFLPSVPAVQPLVFHPDAFEMVMDLETGLAIRFVRQYDATLDLWPRFDVVYGCVYPTLAARIRG